MRLDKLLSHGSTLSRRQAAAAIRARRVTIEGEVCRKAAHDVSPEQEVQFDGQPIELPPPRYLMMNKAVGEVCSQVYDGHASVLDRILLPEGRDNLHFAGRLDADVSGLLLITDDGQWSHRITAPGKGCRKVYEITLAQAPDPQWAEQLARGVVLRGETRPTRPAILSHVAHQPDGSWTCRLSVEEGRYHLVKRLCAAMGQPLQHLHRLAIGTLQLDPDLAPGQWRFLSPDEQAAATTAQQAGEA